MEYKLELPIKKGDKIFTIDNCKIETYYVEGLATQSISLSESDISYNIVVKLERYNDNVNSYKTQKRLSECFLSKEDLIKQL